MKNFFAQLHQRNTVLYYFGITCLFCSALCLLMMVVINTQVLGINAYIKPAKFFLSVSIASCTFGWLLFYLDKQQAVRRYSWMTVIVMTLELSIIAWQAVQGKRSHFNNSTPLDGILFGIMGLAIIIYTVWTGYMGWLFIRQKNFSLTVSYLWGIRLGIILFVVFAFEGFFMVGNNAHTIGAPDGGPGLPFVNWSTHHGDLRIAHFLGMHSLQIFPAIGYLMNNNKRTVVYIAACYFFIVTALLMEALMGIPFLKI